MAEPASAALLVGLKTFFPKVAVFILDIAPTVVGSLLSVRIYPERPLKVHVFAVISSVALFYYVGQGAAEYFGWKSGFFLDGLKFVVGLYGYSILMSVSKQIEPAIAGLHAKFTGGAP